MKLTLEPYLGKGILITTTVLILCLFALRKFPKGVYFSLFFIFSILASLFISVSSVLPKLGSQTLLDRPFVEMLLYLPLSILGGLGLAGLLETIKETPLFSKKANLYTRVLVSILIVGFISISSLKEYDFYPAECCNFVGYDDTVIFDWMSKNLPSDARVLVASNKLQVIPSSASTDFVGSDAGIWIPILANREISMMPYQLDFLSQETILQLCQKQATHIYVDNENQSFNGDLLAKKTAWYKAILYLPNAQLYQLKACKTTN